MRIIAGERKGMTLAQIGGDGIRPTSDKVRGAVFSSLESMIGPIGVFVDCFGGSGALSIEALSRGAEEAYMFERSRRSLGVIRKNLRKAGYEGRVRLYPIPAKKGLGRLAEEGVRADVFFMDPPYREIGQVYELMEIIHDSDLLADGGVIMIEHDKNDIMAQVANGFEIYKEKKYGNTVITVYTKKP